VWLTKEQTEEVEIRRRKHRFKERFAEMYYFVENEVRDM
jgi:hypothetical protein